MSDDINVNMIADALNRKVDLPDNKGQDGIDYVVEWKTPTTSDPTWYRVYKSGWVEQGGRVIQHNYTTINFLKPMRDLSYSLHITECINSTTGVDTQRNDTWILLNSDTTTTSAYVYINNNNNNVGFIWEVKGQGANQ